MDLNEKFHDCCEDLLTPSDLEAVREILNNLSELDSVRRLTRHLAFKTRSDRDERFIHRNDKKGE